MNEVSRGPIIAIGGAEDLVRDSSILTRFIELAGGSRARIAVIPTASRLPDTGAIYADAIRRLGGGHVTTLAIRCRADAETEAVLDALGEADGIFMTGGNQLRLSSIIGGSSAARTIRHRNLAGSVVAGTSAGAAVLSEHMIAYGEEGATPRAGMVSLIPGLGLMNNIIVDQHFRQRDRLGRLLTALAYNPFALGVGLDENTAIVLDAAYRAEVIGTNAVTIVDASGIDHNGMGNVRRGEPVSLFGVRLHIVVGGDRFDFRTRRASVGNGNGDDHGARQRDADRDVDGISVTSPSFVRNPENPS